ncbi:hypothetical protein C3747_12g2021c [Trypanosoma cruzi]|uniref:Transmembrane protein 14 n=2 Tax=Trypanosoma cruzi TaxID=5693 RepID=Q4D3L3_TRYCC|nr:hypothetical protein, conserved [Trypanosoma cruzi]EAN87110.1 hypothetical protein, conserved [Trypanosoma cruzi]PWV18786.1 hypothetical protein C3747_12g2021c [Trypanosoma cruzi]RNC41998.1 putative transmembrane protein [Trypanosoma cruzi]|eukprot:XP_808961.1 hypothetical protein [Trypanosoma cruzi strain CL Brener]
MASTLVAGTLSVLLPVGGVMGYRKGSAASLVAGSVTGALMGTSLFFLLKDPASKAGNRIAAAVSFFLASTMGYRYYKGRKTVPLVISSVNAFSLLVFGPNCF